jgi:hypothetical protein
MSPWLIQTFFLSLPRIWARRRAPSKHCASRRPLPSILTTCAYSWPSSLKTSSRFSLSFSFFPRRLFLPPCCEVLVACLGGEGEKMLRVWRAVALVVQRRSSNVVHPSAWRQQHHNLRAPITCARADAWRGSSFSHTLAGSVTHLSLVLRHIGDLFGSLSRKVGGGVCWVSLRGCVAGLVGIILNAKAAWGECVIQHRATGRCAPDQTPFATSGPFRSLRIIVAALPPASNATQTQLLPASLSLVVRSSSSQCLPILTYAPTHTLLSPHTFETNSMAACHPSPTASPS